MRLKTKFQDEDFDLGEVVEANVYYGGSGRIKVIAEPAKGGVITFYFETLKGMNEMFEDATEEPKEYWYIDWTPEIGVYHTRDVASDADERQKEIGNYFSSREEAEKAVEKLKAITRLKNKGFRFDSYDVANRAGDGVLCGQVYFKAGNYDKEEIENDLYLLFSQEDD